MRARDSVAFAAKFRSPFRVSLQILTADSRPCAFDRLDKIFQHQWRFEQLVWINVDPCHFHRAFVAW